MVWLTACGSGSVDRFNESMKAGRLSEAQNCLSRIGNGDNRKICALRLIQAYIEVDAPEKAIYVYEYITPQHKDRYKMQWYNSKYEKEVCKLLRDYLVKSGEYEKALNYYPLEYEDENDIGNAQSRYIYQ